MEEEYIEEACFYLLDLKLSSLEIGKEFNMTSDQVERAAESYRAKIDSGTVSYDEETKAFWAKSLKESSGDEKITLVDEKGRYYHGWKSEIEKMSTEQLVELLVVNKQYSDRHPLSEFSKTQPVVGYDPLIPLRNIRRTVAIIDETLQKREND
ncbi:MAG TPA: hypothetical protein VNE86_02315 [Nitrososphaerales archaeon]|nr:hypothetical protein [Nitrososphaerales archaeon]